VAIFAAAADRVRHAAPPAGDDAQLASLREQLLHSFVPDHGSEFFMAGPSIGPGGK
jgi:hypothetical protein